MKTLGIFDSGVGGLTVLREIVARGSAYDRIVYFGDTGRVPYGTRSRETIVRYSRQDVRFLLSRGADEIIVACGTASANALDELKASFSQPITGVIDVSAEAAVAATKNGRIGVIGTAATVKSGVYPRKLKALSPSVEVFGQACPLLVPLAEYGFAEKGNEIARLTCAHYLGGLKEKGIDTLILGCTHFPLFSGMIGEYLGPGVRLINSGAELARRLASPRAGTPALEFYVSDDPAGFCADAAIFLGAEHPVSASLTDIAAYPAD